MNRVEKIRDKFTTVREVRLPIFLKIVMISLFFSVLSLSLYIATLYTPGLFVLEYLVYIGVIILGISFFAAGSIVEPLEQLRKGFEGITQGIYTSVEVNSGDELEDLANSFNIMAHELKIQREIIEKSEEKYRYLVEDINDWVFELDEQFALTYSSSKIEELAGQGSTEVLGRPIFDFVVDEDREKLREEFENLKENEQPFSGIEVVINSPSEIIVEIGGRPFFDEDGKLEGFRCLGRDITYRKKSEERATYLANILEHTVDAVVSLDLDTRIVSWNRGAEMMFGYTEEEMLGKPLQTLVPEGQLDTCAQNFRNAVKYGYVRNIETIRIARDGSEIIVDQTITGIKDPGGELTSFVAIMRDVTQRKEDEKALKDAYRQLEEKTDELVKSQTELNYLANMVENSNDAIFSIDLDGIITSWNKTAEKTFGWKEGEVIGKNAQLLLPEELKEEINTICKRVRGRASYMSYETRRKTRDGDILDVEVTISPVYDQQGNLSRVSLISRDISTRLRVEKELMRKMSKHDVEKGKVYLVSSPELADDVVADLIKCGFEGTVVSRRVKDDILCSNANLYYLSEKTGKNIIPPDLDNIRERVVNLPGWNNAVLIDLDYLVFKQGFEEVLEFVQSLKDVFYMLKKGIIVLNVDPSLLDEKQHKLLKKECETIRSKTFDLPPEVFELARYVYRENRLGRKPSIKDIMDRFDIARNTVKKRVDYLKGRGLISIVKDGRIKLLELTDYGKDYFRVAAKEEGEISS